MSVTAVAAPRRARRLRLPRRWDARLAVAGLVLLALAVVLASAHVLPGPTAQDPAVALRGPSGAHPLGTDQFGRDIFSRTLAGVRASLLISVLGVLVGALVGVAGGVLAGFVGGRSALVVLRITDVLFACPAILLALVIVTALGHGALNAGIAIAAVYAPQFVRVARGPTLALRSADFVQAGRALGFRTPRLLAVHILPNLLPTIVVQLSLALSTAILVESSLSFLGLGTQPPQASLGLMVNDARPFAPFAPWMLAAPSVALVVAVVTFNLLGDALRDVLDRSGR